MKTTFICVFVFFSFLMGTAQNTNNHNSFSSFKNNTARNTNFLSVPNSRNSFGNLKSITFQNNNFMSLAHTNNSFLTYYTFCNTPNSRISLGSYFSTILDPQISFTIYAGFDMNVRCFNPGNFTNYYYKSGWSATEIVVVSALQLLNIFSYVSY